MKSYLHPHDKVDSPSEKRITGYLILTIFLLITQHHCTIHPRTKTSIHNNFPLANLAKGSTYSLPLTMPILSTVATRKATADAKLRMETERLNNKKKNASDRKEEEAAKKEEDDRAVAEAIQSNIKWAKDKKEKERSTIEQKKEAEMEVDQSDIPDVNINNHLSALNDLAEDRSPAKSKRKTSTQKVPTQKSSIRVPKFSLKSKEKQHEFTHPFTLVLAAVTMVGEDPVVSFVNGIKSLVKDIISVDPKACLVNLYDRTKYIAEPALIPINQTALGAYIKVSTYGDKNPFSKQKNNNYNKKKKNDNEWKDPTVYFQFAVASELDPTTITERVRLEWFRIGGVKLHVKELQSLNVDSTHVIYNVVTRGNDVDVLTEELRSTLNEARDEIREEQGTNGFFTPGVPPFALRSSIPKLDGQNTANLKNLSYEVQNCRRAWHVECESSQAGNLKTLISIAKERGIWEKWWGSHAHISEILDFKAAPGEVKNMVSYAQHHTNYQASMTSDSLAGITNLEATATIYSSESNEPLLTLSLRHVLMEYFMYPNPDGKGYDKEQKLFAEIHQGKSPGSKVAVVIPNTTEVERMMMSLNKNFPTVLQHILTTQGLPPSFITEIIKSGVCPVQVANMVNCKYNVSTNTLTTNSEDNMDKARSAMSNAKWFKNSFDLSELANKSKKKSAPPPELMFNIDGTRSVKTIHEKKGENIQKKGNKVTPSAAVELSSDSSSSSGSSSPSGSSISVKSLSIGSLKTPSCNNSETDEDSTSSSRKERSHSQATVGKDMTVDPASSDEVNGSAQGATRSG